MYLLVSQTFEEAISNEDFVNRIKAMDNVWYDDVSSLHKNKTSQLVIKPNNKKLYTVEPP